MCAESSYVEVAVEVTAEALRLLQEATATRGPIAPFKVVQTSLKPDGA